ncbi:ankyrin repeat-containing domain protein [Favolaschia claudopus]|uniref:Ankyrin repeat-containing domain protein n=1 Tax=Favolaschia claudopus TaxID=2862362 RepID=A0AAW0AJT4_9AGAR
MAGNLEIANLLLEAGANPAASWSQDEPQPLHFAAMNKNLAMMKLLLDHGAPLEHRFGLCDRRSENALHHACTLGHMEMINLLLERGAQLEAWGHYGTPLGFAIDAGNVEVVKFLLETGADANVTVPLFVLITASDTPARATPLYIAMGLRHPRSMSVAEGRSPARWEGLPLGDKRKQLMALLMAHGATKEGAMATITQYVKPLAEAALYSEEEYLKIVAGMFKEAEEAIPEVVS